MKIKEYNQMMAYLTRPKDSLKNIMKKSEFVKEQKKKNDTVDTSSLEQEIKKVEKELSEDMITTKQRSKRIEDQPGYNMEKDPNLLRRIKVMTKVYDNNDIGNALDKAIDNEDKALAKLGRSPQNILQRNKQPKPFVKKPAASVKDIEPVPIDFTVPNYDFFKKEPPSQAETELVKLINDAKKEKEKNNSLGLAGLLGVTNNI
tara:strand:+ start:924 stop:1532 length:609 start_codon:yes stop_codon:yes gene_type:complete